MAQAGFFSFQLVALTAAGVLLSVPSHGAQEKGELSETEINTWLDASPEEKADREADLSEVPPPPPRHHGFTIASDIGALGHLGDLKNVSPASPWLHMLVGYEVFSWAMVFTSADVAFSDTSYVEGPSRAFAMYGLGGGFRLTIPMSQMGIFAQFDAGAAKVSQDVLTTLGYNKAHEFAPYFGGMLGAEFYQINPRYALVAQGGVRNLNAGFDSINSTQVALAWLGSAGLRYTF